MKTIIGALILLIPSMGLAEDSVTMHILDAFDTSAHTNIHPVKRISGGGVKKIWAWLRFRSDSSLVSDQLYYFEWGYDDGAGRIKYENHEDNYEVYTHKRKTDRMDDYTWKAKRIWMNNKGTYDFQVKIKDSKSGKLVSVDSAEIIVE